MVDVDAHISLSLPATYLDHVSCQATRDPRCCTPCAQTLYLTHGGYQSMRTQVSTSSRAWAIFEAGTRRDLTVRGHVGFSDAHPRTADSVQPCLLVISRSQWSLWMRLICPLSKSCAVIQMHRWDIGRRSKGSKTRKIDNISPISQGRSDLKPSAISSPRSGSIPDSFEALESRVPPFLRRAVFRGPKKRRNFFILTLFGRRGPQIAARQAICTPIAQRLTVSGVGMALCWLRLVHSLNIWLCPASSRGCWATFWIFS